MDRIATAHREGWVKLLELHGGGWIEEHEGFTAGLSGIPAPPFNGATVYSRCDEAALHDTLSRIAISGLPYTLQTRPELLDTVASLGERFGMERQPGTPLMALSQAPAGPVIEGLKVRRLSANEGGIHAVIAAEAFDASLELMRELTAPRIAGHPDIHLLTGEWVGQPVSTAMVDVNGEVAGISNVATLKDFRRRGFGAAVAAAAVNVAFDSGAHVGFLLSSPMGVGVYRGLGFRQLEQWTSWVFLPEF